MFFTLEDERARIKGSRDPLGLLPVWAPFGRTVVSNLTTVSNSVRGFTVLLLARYFGARIIESGRAKEDDALAMFLRFEQMAAYVREHANSEGGAVRGIERVRKNLRERGKKMPIGDDKECFILSDQKTYGLWGLFSVPSRVSDLIPAGAVGVTGRAQEFIDAQYAPLLRRHEAALFKLMKDGGQFGIRNNDALFVALSRALPAELTATERTFYGAYLRDGSAVETAVPGVQEHLARLLTEHDLLGDWIGREAIVTMREASLRQGNDVLAQRLLKIADVEAFIAPAEAMFQHLMACDGHTVDQVARTFTDQWGGAVPNLHPDRWDAIACTVAESSGEDLVSIMNQAHVAFRSGDYPAAVRAIVAWNGHVMKARKGNAWMTLRNDKLDVKYREEERRLPTDADLPTLWRNTYFIDSLRAVTAQLSGPQRSN